MLGFLPLVVETAEVKTRLAARRGRNGRILEWNDMNEPSVFDPHTFNNALKTFPPGVVFYDNGHYARTQRCTTPTGC